MPKTSEMRESKFLKQTDADGKLIVPGLTRDEKHEEVGG